MVDIKTHTGDIARIINLSEVETSEALQTASICETIKVRIHNLTPNRGPVSIPVRFENPINTTAIERLEEIAKYGIATKQEYRAMETIHRIMSDKIHIFTRSELEAMKNTF